MPGYGVPIMRIAIVGVGSIGGIILGCLADTDARILCISRGQTASNLRDGLVMKTPEGAMEAIPSERYEVLDSHRDENIIGQVDSVDVAIISGKAHSTNELASISKRILDENGIVVSIQNGLGNAELLASQFGLGGSLAGSTTHSAWRSDDGVVNWSGRGSIDLGHLDGSDPNDKALDLIGYLGDSGLNPQWSNEIRGVLWKKLLINVAINPICAIVGVRNGALARDPMLWDQAIQTMKEAEIVARASGIDLGDLDIERCLREVVSNTSENRVSMLQDIMAGKKTEIEVLCGAVVQRGEELGIPTPMNQMLLTLVRGIEESVNFD